MKSVSNSILRRIRAKGHGWVFTPKDFIDLASRNTVGVVLFRLAQQGIIRKIGRGIYDFPVKHPKLGPLAANPDAIAQAVATRSGDTIQPSSAQLANQLGFDTQVPANPAYITTGNSTKKRIADYPITLSHSKYLSKVPLNTNVIKVVSALLHIGKDNIRDDMITKCKKLLLPKDKSQLKKNLRQFPNWLIPFIIKIIEK